MSRPMKCLEVTLELARRLKMSELPEHLVTASDALFQHEMLCAELGVSFPPSLERAWRSIRAELRRLEKRAGDR